MASTSIPKGSLENYAHMVQAKVEKFEEDEKKFGGLTEQEILDAEQLVDPNARAMN